MLATSLFCNRTVASVAQLVEQLTLNQLVLGSSPSRGTIFSMVTICDTERHFVNFSIVFKRFVSFSEAANCNSRGRRMRPNVWRIYVFVVGVGFSVLLSSAMKSLVPK